VALTHALPHVVLTKLPLRLEKLAKKQEVIALVHRFFLKRDTRLTACGKNLRNLRNLWMIPRI
jgi:hypothetical protein